MNYPFGYKKSCLLLAALLTVNLLFTGCSPDKDTASARQTRKAVQNALDTFAQTGDIEKARAQMRQVSPASASGKLVKANLAYAQAKKTEKQITSLKNDYNNQLSILNDYVAYSQEMTTEKQRMQNMLTRHDQQITNLRQRLQGSADSKGLEEQIQQNQQQIQQLNSQIETLKQQAEEDKQTAMAIENQARQLLRQAQQAQPNKKAQLQEQAYDILLGKGDGKSKAQYMKQAQNALDQTELLHGQLNILQKQLENRLTAAQQIRTQIENLQSADTVSKIRAQITQIDNQLRDIANKTSSQIRTANDISAQITQTAENIFQSYETAASNYQSIRSDDRDITDTAKISAADTYTQASMLALDLGTFYNDAAAIFAFLAKNATPQVSSSLNSQAAQMRKQANDYLKMETFDKADHAFEKLSSLTSRGSDKIATALLKSHLAALNTKLRAAQTVGNNSQAASTRQKMDSIISKLTEIEPAFDQSQYQN